MTDPLIHHIRFIELLITPPRADHPFRDDSLYEMSETIFHDLLTVTHGDMPPDYYMADYPDMPEHVVIATINALRRSIRAVTGELGGPHWLSVQRVSRKLCPEHRRRFHICRDLGDDSCQVLRNYFD